MLWHVMTLVIAVTLTAVTLFGSMYVLFFAVLGNLEKRRESKRSQLATSVPTTKFLVLIPAHDEEAGIAATLTAIRELDYPPELYRAVVIADNCRDRTAEVVDRFGIECWVRDEPTLGGKPRAIHWALERARTAEFDAIVLIDADSMPEKGLLSAFDREVRGKVRVAQAWYEFELADRKWFSLYSSASKRAENELFWAPRDRMGLAVFLQGNGICVQRDVLEQVGWNAYSIVEDVEYSMHLLLAGVAVKLVSSAKVTARSVKKVRHSFSQRLRWSSGTFNIMRQYVPRLIADAIRTRKLSLLEAAVALLFTSRLVLIYLAGLSIGFSWLFLRGPASHILVALSCGAVLLQCCYLVCVIETVSTVKESFLAIAMLPFYLGWMLLIQCFAILGVRRNAWVRTIR